MAFIGIRVPLEVARLFRNIDVPGEKVAENEYHITILCFEDEWPVSEVAKAMESAFTVLSKTDPFLISCDTVTCFPKREDNPCPIIAKIKSKELNKLNNDLKKEFDKDNIDYLKTFKDFKPHMTLSYADKEIKDIKLDNSVEFVVNEVVLWAGDSGDDRIFITFPLRSVKAKKHSYLLQRSEIFNKLSGKEQNSVFKRSQERRKLER